MELAISLPGRAPLQKCFLLAILPCILFILIFGGLASLAGIVALVGAVLQGVLLFGVHAPGWFLLLVAIGGGLVYLRGAIA